MTHASGRLHLTVTGTTRGDLGRSRGEQLGEGLAAAYDAYAQLFRVAGASPDRERAGAEQTLEVLGGWRPELVDELEGIAAATGLATWQVAALNARTEILAVGGVVARECSTIATRVAGRRLGVQTWDWHIELDPFWHTQEVDGPGHRYAGLTEQGILGKIGVNEAGLALHFNILGHHSDGVGGVPMHVLSSVVLAECATIDEAVRLVRAAPISSSSAFTMTDATRSVSLEMSPAGVYEITEQDGAVVRTNHFQHPTPLAGQKELYEPDSSERLALVRQRLSAGLPADADELVAMLVSGEGEPPLCCRVDDTLPLGQRWATLATTVTDPAARTIRVLDGMPTDAARGPWRTLSL
ncbi:MAG TPA: C45 family peptidase [Nocardioides sp.]|uniref:C45 family peptidase n=1 Tax=Nocardioides sp. TaxID=35761 RepID=UPI002ED96E5A